MLNPEISPADYVILRDRTAGTPESPILLDVREPWESATASIAGATLIPMAEIPTRAHAELDPDLPYVVFCHHGMRSLSVTMWLRRRKAVIRAVCIPPLPAKAAGRDGAPRLNGQIGTLDALN
jgi:rhodanese-related sulfurtransferase